MEATKWLGAAGEPLRTADLGGGNKDEAERLAADTKAVESVIEMFDFRTAPSFVASSGRSLGLLFFAIGKPSNQFFGGSTHPATTFAAIGHCC